MSLHKVLKKALEKNDVETFLSVFHEDYEFVRHQSGTTMNKAQFSEMVSGMQTNTGYEELMRRCIYENNDILVVHSVMRFKDGSRESVIAVNMLENGKVIRTESGASLMN